MSKISEIAELKTKLAAAWTELDERKRIAAITGQHRCPELFGDYVQATKERDRLAYQVATLREALEAIEEGKGVYSRNPIIYAVNTLENMTSIARAALAATKEQL
jgi:hypothetical protein